MISFLYLRVTTGGVKALISKIVTSVGFMVIGLVGLSVSNLQYGRFIILGLLLGLIGDIVLDLKVIYPESREMYLSSGMISFGIGHVLYAIGITLYVVTLVKDIDVLRLWLLTAAISIATSSLIMLASKSLKLKFGKHFIHAYTYTFLLVAMFVYSLFLIGHSRSMWFCMVGFLLFFLSDIVLSLMYFGDKLKSKSLIMINHTLYYLAQISIASFLWFA